MSEEDYKAVGAIKNQWIETKDEYLDMALNVIDNLKIKNQQLEKRIKKSIEYINFILDQAYSRGNTDVDTIHLAHTASLLRGASDE